MNPTRKTSRSIDAVFYLGPPCLLIVLALCDQWTNFAANMAGLPFVVSLFVLGLPHGAIDWRLASEQAEATSFPLQLRAFSTYLLGMLIMLSLCLIAPPLAIGVFGVISAWHFGLADERDLEDRFPTRWRNPQQKVMAALGRGGLLLALPFAGWPAQSLEATNRLMQLLGSPVSISATSPTRLVAASIMGVALGCVLMAVVNRWRLHGNPALRTEALELGSLLFALSLLPPLFGMGLYFLCWHSWRHWRRIGLGKYSGDVDETSIFRKILRGHCDSLILLVPTLLILAVLAAWRLDRWNLTDLALLSIAVFLVVTPSHDWLIQKVFDGHSARRWTVRLLPRRSRTAKKIRKPGLSPQWSSRQSKMAP